MFGKMSVGVRNDANGPAIRISTASTMKVSGRDRAIRTRPSMSVPTEQRSNGARGATARRPGRHIGVFNGERELTGRSGTVQKAAADRHVVARCGHKPDGVMMARQSCGNLLGG